VRFSFEADVKGHKQVRIKLGTKTVAVDEGMRRLVKALWANGVKGADVCEEDQPGVALITLGLKAAQRFLRVAWKAVDEDMRQRMASPGRQDRWHYDVSLVHLGDGRFEPSVVSVRLPVADKDELARLLETAARRE
jgi:hypothetical protein